MNHTMQLFEKTKLYNEYNDSNTAGLKIFKAKTCLQKNNPENHANYMGGYYKKNSVNFP